MNSMRCGGEVIYCLVKIISCSINERRGRREEKRREERETKWSRRERGRRVEQEKRGEGVGKMREEKEERAERRILLKKSPKVSKR
jgi:hypothetical protein